MGTFSVHKRNWVGDEHTHLKAWEGTLVMHNPIWQPLAMDGQSTELIKLGN